MGDTPAGSSSWRRPGKSIKYSQTISPKEIPATASPAGCRSKHHTGTRESWNPAARERITGVVGARFESRLAWGGTGLPRDQSLPTPLSSPPGMPSARSCGWEDAAERLARPVWGCGRHGEAACVLGSGGVLVRERLARRCGRWL